LAAADSTRTRWGSLIKRSPDPQYAGLLLRGGEERKGRGGEGTGGKGRVRERRDTGGRRGRGEVREGRGRRESRRVGKGKGRRREEGRE